MKRVVTRVFLMIFIERVHAKISRNSKLSPCAFPWGLLLLTPGLMMNTLLSRPFALPSRKGKHQSVLVKEKKNEEMKNLAWKRMQETPMMYLHCRVYVHLRECMYTRREGDPRV